MPFTTENTESAEEQQKNRPFVVFSVLSVFSVVQDSDFAVTPNSTREYA